MLNLDILLFSDCLWAITYAPLLVSGFIDAFSSNSKFTSLKLLLFDLSSNKL